MRNLAMWMLVGIVALNIVGCSGTGLFWQVKSEDPIVLIDNPPMRMVYSGKFTEHDKEMFLKTIREMSKMPYKDHKYTFPIGAQISINEADHSSNVSSVVRTMSGPKSK